MTSLADLVRTAGTSLLPTSPFDAGRMITGVHVSELPDPGRYLDGGELLLTTGIPLTGRRRDA
ncbi:MAG: PucR family transcriptional regulator, partial [Microbacterium sp.]